MLRRQNRQAINVRDAFSLSMSSVDAIRDSAGKVANNRLTEVCRASTQTIALLVFMTILGVPCYAQEVTSSQRAQPAQSTIDQTGQDLDQGNANLPAAAGSSQHSKSGQTVATPNNSYVFPTKRERFNRYVKSTVGPFSLLRTGISAGINQWRDNPEEWEQGASGYGKRFASAFGRNAIQQTVTYGLDSALGLDTGFKKSTRKGFFPRMTDALAANVTSRTRSGSRVISVPKLTGVYTSAIISAETWYPARYNYKDGLRHGTHSLLTGFGLNLVREFIISF